MSDYTTRTVGNGILAIALSFGLAACGDDGTGPRLPDLTRADVAGHYEMTALTFDPQGSLPEADILERLDQSNVPDLFVSSSQDSLQLVFRDPDGGLLRTVPGGYRLGDTGISVTFVAATEPAKLLLPRTLTLTWSDEDEELSFVGSTEVDTERLFQLVPEWSEEPVNNPLPGQLRVVFTRATP